MKDINRIIVFDSDNYIGRFVTHHLKSLIADPENYHNLNGVGEGPFKTGGLLVWASDNPKAGTARRFSEIIQDVKPDAVVMLSTVAVYDVESGENLNELTPVKENHEVAEAERIVKEATGTIPLVILRLPLLTVGTGMDGILRDMVNAISRSTYNTLTDKAARVSVIHATDIGPAIAMVAGADGIFNLTDRADPTVADLADALSYRRGKRIFRTTDKAARRIARLASAFGFTRPEKMYRFKTTTLTFSSEMFYSKFDVRPTDTVNYLKTHNYDENSL